MSATIIAFPAAERLAEVELERQGSNPLEPAIHTGRAIVVDFIGGFAVAALAIRLDHLRRMIARLELTHAAAMDDEAIIPLAAGVLYCPLRLLPDTLAELLAHWPRAA